MVVVLPDDIREIDPRHVSEAWSLKVSRLVFASLVTIDPQTLEPIPDLAERIDVDGVRYVVTLREGLHFSDGSPLTSADVAATFRGIEDPRVGSRYSASYARIAHIETPDARTVVFTLDAPHATFMTDLEVPVVRARDAFLPALREPIGAGPYRIASRSPGHVELRANRYWHRGAVRFPHLRLVTVHDDNTRALRMLAGKGDLAIASVPPLLVPLFAGDPRFRVATAPGPTTTYLGINTTSPLLRDVRVRRAIALAIDRAAIVRFKLGGRARLATSMIPPQTWAHDDGLVGMRYDPTQARALLQRTERRGEEGNHLVLRTSTDRFRLSVARAIAAMLRDVGLEVDVRPSELPTLIADLDRGHFDLTIMQSPEIFEPHVLSWLFASEHVPGQGHVGANRWRIRNAELDAALERGRVTSDRPTRIAAYHDVQRILAEELPVIPLWHEDVVAITDARMPGYVVPRDGRLGTLAR